MSTDARAQRDGAGYAAQPVTKPPAWHGLVAWDMLLNNLTTGLFLAAALGELSAPEAFTPVAKAAYPLALALLLADLVCLVLDLGDPLRFHHMLRVFKPTSPMSLGTWCLTIYSLPLTVAAALSLWPAGGPALEWARKAAVALGLLPALGSAVYKGVLLSTNAQPSWRDARWLGGYLTNSALLLGCAEMLVLATLLGQDRAGALLRPALVLLLVLNLLPLCLVVRNLRPALSRAYTPGQLGRLAALCVGVGTLVPLALLLAGGSPLPVLFLLLGSLALRFVIVRLPHASS
jgi:Ni/Fe-hydrogenase subunit HybB-like protein